MFGSKDNKPTLGEVENAFQPAKEVRTPERFAGREDAVEDAYYGLVTEGSNLAIVGNRGIGKSSLARQVIKMSTGDKTLLKKYGYNVEGRLDFLPIYFACGDSVSNTDELLERLLTSRSCLLDWIYDIPKAKRELGALNSKLDLGIGSVGGESTKTMESEKAVSNHSIDTVFLNVLQSIVESGLTRNGVLIVIDEFDQIDDPSGFSRLLKSLATNVPKVKFVIVGVAQDIRNLIDEHKSADRLFAGSIVKLRSMTPPELGEIIEIAEGNIDGYIKFSDEAQNQIISLAQGHPYMVHLVGKYALRIAYREDRRTIDDSEVDHALKTIAERGADPVLEGRYKKAVQSSAQRETVLRSMAANQEKDGEIWTTDAYKLALDNGVDNASQYVGQLVTEDYGAELSKIRDRYYRFKDSLFAAYVEARPRVFEVESD
jgi:Cdc6-like AAA superfamily ATPase